MQGLLRQLLLSMLTELNHKNSLLVEKYEYTMDRDLANKLIRYVKAT